MLLYVVTAQMHASVSSTINRNSAPATMRAASGARFSFFWTGTSSNFILFSPIYYFRQRFSLPCKVRNSSDARDSASPARNRGMPA